MRYKRARIRDFAGTLAQRHFPGRQRTNNANPGLYRDDTNCPQVCESKPRISDPRPIKGFPDKDKHQANDHKYNEQDVTEENRISG